MNYSDIIPGISRVYKLYNDQTEDFYVGSATIPLNARLSGHVCCAHGGRNSLLYQKMREVGTRSWKIREISKHENIYCHELRYFERKAMEELHPNLNHNLPIISEQEKKEQHDSFTQAKLVCACGATFSYRNKTNHIRTKKHLDKMKEIEAANDKEMVEQALFD